MTQLLIRALEAAIAGPAEKKKMQNQIVRRELAMMEKALGVQYMIEGEDGKVGKARELLLSTSIESTTLIQTEINRTILEGSEPARCFRLAVPVFPMNAKAMQINVGETGTYAPIVAEGAEIPINTQDYTARTWTSQKLGERPVITREMVDDSLFSVIELEVRKAGMRIENSLNQWMLSELLDHSGNDYDIAAVASGGTAGIKAVIKARQECVTDGFIPDTIVMHPACTAYLYQDFVPGYNVLSQGYVNTGQLPNLMGCRVFECGVDCTSTSDPFKVAAAASDWSGPTDAKKGGVVFDAKSCGGIGMRQDIRVERYADPIRDLIGMGITMRVACQYGVANSICTIQYHGA